MNTVRLTFFILLISGAATTSVQAQSSNGIFRCAGENDVPVYTNNTQGQKGCERVSGVEVTTVPAFKAPPSTSRNTTVSNQGPSDFPKVDTDVQRQRDELGRKPILERELRDREERCAAVRKDSNNGNPLRPAAEDAAAYNQRVAQVRQQIDRCDADLAAIRREINALR